MMKKKNPITPTTFTKKKSKVASRSFFVNLKYHVEAPNMATSFDRLLNNLHWDVLSLDLYLDNTSMLEIV
jgi:hypothetical protein